MPELPEVESLRRSLLPRLQGARIESVQVLRADIIGHARLTRARAGATRLAPACSPALDERLLVGDRVARLDRRGKQLLAVSESGRGLVIHLGMTGQVLVLGPGEPLPTTHVHIVWTLHATKPGPGERVVFRDPRRFGGILLIDRAGEHNDPLHPWSALGPDALSITGEALRERAAGGRRAIKSALLDQGVLAGVGNIYADEACFRAGLRPGARCTRIKQARWNELAGHVRAVLAEAVEARGSSLRDYRDAAGQPGAFQQRHQVYGRGGEPCVRCGARLRSGTLAGRTTVWCATCQAST